MEFDTEDQVLLLLKLIGLVIHWELSFKTIKTVRDNLSLVYSADSEQDDASLYIVQVLVPKPNASKGVSDIAENFCLLILLALHRDDSASNLCTN